MSRRRLLACIALVPVWLGGIRRALAQPKVEASRQRRIALVIGNGRYAEFPLNNPEHDARLIAQALRTLGFEVGEHLNLKARDFKRALREFAQRMDDDQVASVFYYAGHGVQIGGRNYLLPVDITLRDEAEVRDEAIDLQEALLAHVDRVRPRARIFIIDACRNDPFAARGRSSRKANGLAEMAAPGALIAFSASPGRVAEDGPVGGNSIYTRHLADELRTSGVEVEEMMKAVRIKVLRDTAQRQIPWVNTSMVVNFMFNPGPAAAAQKRSLQLLVQAQRSLNTDASNAPASLALRIYVLRDASGFENASFDSLYDNDETTLGSSMLLRESMHLRPGEARELAIEVSGDARAVGVFGAFREMERAQWRAILPVPAGALAPRARIDAQARQVQLEWAR